MHADLLEPLSVPVQRLPHLRSPHLKRLNPAADVGVTCMLVKWGDLILQITHMESWRCVEFRGLKSRNVDKKHHRECWRSLLVWSDPSQGMLTLKFLQFLDICESNIQRRNQPVRNAPTFFSCPSFMSGCLPEAVCQTHIPGLGLLWMRLWLVQRRVIMEDLGAEICLREASQQKSRVICVRLWSIWRACGACCLFSSKSLFLTATHRGLCWRALLWWRSKTIFLLAYEH